MKAKLLLLSTIFFAFGGWMQSAQAIAVDLELVIAQDVSGSIDNADFNLSRSGIEAAFRDADLISKIESGSIGSIAVTLWDFASSATTAVDWTLIDDAASSNAFADAVASASRGSVGISDGQINVINQSLISLNNNNYEGTRSVLDIISEGRSSSSCSSVIGENNVSCQGVQDARDNFLNNGGDAINALWLNDRNFFGLDPEDSVNAFLYGALNVIGGDNSFQKFATDFTEFAPVFRDKVIAEIDPPSAIPVPAALPLFLSALAGLGFFGGLRQRKAA